MGLDTTYRFTVSLNTNNLIELVKLQKIELNESGNITVLVENVPMTTNNNTVWSCDVMLSNENANKPLDYTIYIEEKIPKNPIYPDMLEDLYIKNIYTINGKIKFGLFTRKDYKFCKRMFVTLTGRFDLVANPNVDDYSDVYNILYIIFNSAQKYLDTLFDISKLNGFFYYFLPAYQDFIPISNVRYIKKVYEVSDFRELNLDEMDYKRFIQLEYCPLASGFVPEQLNNETVINDNVRIVLGLPEQLYREHYPTKLIWTPYKNYDRHILVETYYYSKELLNDDDVTFWTSQYTELLVRTAVMFYEKYNRNFDEADRLERSINMEVLNISKDYHADFVNSIPYYNMKMRT